MGKMMDFFRSVRVEMGKVRWPNKKEMTKFSIASIVFILIFSVFFLVGDLIIAFIVRLVG